MFDTFQETGTVLAIEEDRAVVELTPRDAAQCARCGICASGAERDQRVKTVTVGAVPGLATGDRVSVEVCRPNPAVASLAVFGLPLLLTSGGVGAGLVLADGLGFPRTAGGVAGGALGLVASLVAVRGVEGWLQRRGAFRARILPATE